MVEVKSDLQVTDRQTGDVKIAQLVERLPRGLEILGLIPQSRIKQLGGRSRWNTTSTRPASAR